MESKWTEIKYHIQNDVAMELKDVKMYCNRNQFPEFSFSGPHSKPHDKRVLSKHYHFRFDPKIVLGVCVILRIHCACVVCTSMLDKYWMSGIPSDKQERYKPC